MNNKIQSSFSGSTPSFAKVMCGALIMSASNGIYAFQTEKKYDSNLGFVSSSSQIASSTFDHNIITASKHEPQLEEMFMQTYEKILSESVSMDADFAQYISENIEDLF